MENVQDLTKQSDVVELMKSSKSEQEWNANCKKVKSANGGNYPGFWYAAVVNGGALGHAMAAGNWIPE